MPRTEIVVVVSSNLARGTVLRSVRLVAQRSGASTSLHDQVYDLANLRLPLPGGVTFVAKDPDDARALTVRVIGDVGGRMLQQDAVVRFQQERTLYLHMTLAGECIESGCNNMGLTCRLGTCERPEQATVSESAPTMLLQSDGGVDVPDDLRDAATLVDQVATDAVDVADASNDASDVVAPIDATDVVDATDAVDATNVVDATDVVDAPGPMDVVRDVVEEASMDVHVDVAPDTSVDVAPRMDAVSDAASEVLTATDASDAADTSTGMDVLAEAQTDSAGVDVPPGDAGATAPPRLLAPLSTSTVTSQTPTLRWSLAAGTTGAQLEVCADRACSLRERNLDVTGSSTTLAIPLTAGVHYWRMRPLGGGGTSSPVWQFHVGARSAPQNGSFGTTLDVNGDGFADVVVGSDGSNTAYLYRGSASGLGATPTTLAGPMGSTRFGLSVASAGDVNGDGFAEVVVGAFDSNVAHLYLGSASGPSTTPIPLTGPTGSSGFGISVASAGDVNGDGFADVVVGARASNTAYLYLGSASGPGAVPVTLTRPADSSAFGESVASAGDVNGDGFADVVVGAYNANAAHLYLGSTNGPSITPIPLTGPTGSSLFGISVASAGDVNGDGFADVVVGTFGSATAYVYLGSASGLGAMPSTLTGPIGGTSRFGYSVASAGDVNRDGFADVVVGAYNANTAYVYLGSGSGLGTTPSTLTRPTGSSGFGGSVAGAGDVNGDTFADVVVGGHASNTAYLYRGSGSGPSTMPTTLTGPMGSTLFGISVASAGGLPPPPSGASAPAFGAPRRLTK